MAPKNDFDDSFKMTRFALLVSGIDVYEKSDRRWLKLFSYLFHINLVWLYTDVVGELFWLVEGIRVGKSFEQLSIIAPCTTICLLATARSSPLYLNRDSILNIFNKLRQLHPGTKNDDNTPVDGTDKANESYSEIENKIKVSTTDILNKLTTFMSISNLIVIIAFCFLPLFSMWVEYNQTGVLKLKLPFLVKYFFDPFTKTRWPLIYIHQIWSTFIVCFNIFGADTTFHAFCLYLRMHFEILCHRFEGVVTPCARETKMGIRKLVQRHQELIQLVEEIEAIYSKSTLFNIVVSSVLICLSVFNITFIDDFGAVFSFSSFLVMSLYQIFMSCYFGDMIVTSSLQVHAALYRCKWYDAEPSIKRTILIIMLRSQKPCSVTAAKFATLNISAFTTILSRSWSYFALLSTMYK
ncbi:unnamed protein product [Colias eurytheme]|nr:unnamed protein product [Colias eurytheme]